MHDTMEQAEEMLKDLKATCGNSEAGRAAAVALTHFQTARLWQREAERLHHQAANTAPAEG